MNLFDIWASIFCNKTCDPWWHLCLCVFLISLQGKRELVQAPPLSEKRRSDAEACCPHLSKILETKTSMCCLQVWYCRWSHLWSTIGLRIHGNCVSFFSLDILNGQDAYEKYSKLFYVILKIEELGENPLNVSLLKLITAPLQIQPGCRVPTTPPDWNEEMQGAQSASRAPDKLSNHSNSSFTERWSMAVHGSV